jgi:endoglucanase
MLDYSPYTINSTWMSRVETVVDWALAKGMFAIINVHHETWLDDSSNFTNELPMFEAIWTQICEKFNSKSYYLLYETFNEPAKMSTDNLNTMNAAAVKIIRASSGNDAKRGVLIPGGLDYSNPSWLVTNYADFKVPSDDYVMLEVHSYNPYKYTKKDPTSTFWGTSSDLSTLDTYWSDFDTVIKKLGVKVLLGEFGATTQQTAATGRYHWYGNQSSVPKSYGYAVCVWDDTTHQVYDRTAGTWDNSVLKALGLSSSVKADKTAIVV